MITQTLDVLVIDYKDVSGSCIAAYELSYV